jgi:hypothetical protein
VKGDIPPPALPQSFCFFPASKEVIGASGPLSGGFNRSVFLE